MVLDVANEALTLFAGGVREKGDWLDLISLKMGVRGGVETM